VTQTLKDHLALYDQTLGATGWFAGAEMTAADIMMSFPLEAASVRAGARNYPNIAAFLDRIHARPAYQAALKRFGPYAYV
jgi:glutathione S-transferase